MALSPGLSSLVQSVPAFAVPLGIIFAGKRLLESRGAVVSGWVYIVACMLWHPLVFTARVLYWDYREWSRARALGARRIPRITGRLPGRLDRLLDAMGRFEGYAGEFPAQARDHNIRRDLILTHRRRDSAHVRRDGQPL
jgi:hypothetical protein